MSETPDQAGHHSEPQLPYPAPFPHSKALPAFPSTFVGRAEDLARLRALTAAHRLVTVLGPGGVGKTRLALEFAHDHERRRPAEGLWFADLAALNSGDLLVETIAAAAGLNGSPADPMDLLRAHATDRPRLLILDNCEHLSDQVAEFVTALLPGAHALRILATSREALQLSGEAIYRLSGLPLGDTSRSSARLGDAVTLFTDRARQLEPQFAVDNDNHRTILEICHRLDGLPLAIELAASRIQTLTPQQILERLDDPLDFLSRNTRDITGRNQSVRASIEWSYELCPPDERELWDRLSAFTGPFTIEDVHGVCAGPADSERETADRVQALMSKAGLLSDETGQRKWLRMLNVIQHFGREHLDVSGELETTLDRHMNWYADIGRDLETDWLSPHQTIMFANAQAALPNIRAAAEHALSTTPPAPRISDLVVLPTPQLWWAGGRLDEGRYWIDRALKVLPPGPERLLALVDGVTLAAAKGDFTRATALQAQAESLRKEAGLNEALPRTKVLFSAALLRLLMEQFEEAIAICNSMIALTEEIPLEHGHFRARQVAAYACTGLGDPERGRIFCQELIELSDQVGEIYHRAFAQHLLALYAWRAGDVDEAATLSDQAMRLSRPFPNRPENPDALLIAGFIAADVGETERAAVLFGAAEGSSRTRLSTSGLFAASVQDAANLRAKHAKIREIDHPYAVTRGLRMVPAEAIDFALRVEKPGGNNATILSKRELAVAALVAEGLTNRQIASRFVLSVRTIEGHVDRIRQKLGFQSRVQVGTWYQQTYGDMEIAE